jgi:hypothetical protein
VVFSPDHLPTTLVDFGEHRASQNESKSSRIDVTGGGAA